MTNIGPTPEAVADMDRLREEVQRLRRWKTEASEVIVGLQDLGRALDIPLGKSITGTLAAEIAGELRAKVAQTNDERNAALSIIADVETMLNDAIAAAIENRVRAARADVRCLDCSLRYEERQEYGCHEPGRGHSYADSDLAATEEIERTAAVEYITMSVPDLRAALNLESGS